MSRLKFSIVPVHRVSRTDQEIMQKLFLQYYEVPDPEDFFRDFMKKDDVIILRDKKNKSIQGFSTQKVISHSIDGKHFTGVFSGDTLVDKKYWGDPALGFGFFCYLMKVNLRAPTQKLYWHLISKGYKTYLLLTNNFDKYYPRHDAQTPLLAQELMDSFAEQMYPENFRRDLGLLVFQEPHEKLKSDVAPITAELKEKNPKIKFFEDKNPHWQKGEELVCLGEFHLLLPLIHVKKVLLKSILRTKVSHGRSLPTR